MPVTQDALVHKDGWDATGDYALIGTVDVADASTFDELMQDFELV